MPCVALAAHRARSAHLLVADAEQRPDFAVNSDVDFLPGIGADKMQPLHAGSRWLEATLAPNLIAVRGKNLPARSRSGEQKTFLYDPLILVPRRPKSQLSFADKRRQEAPVSC
jgi:hypothetical protein